MAFWFLIGAAGVCTIWLVIHLTLGRRDVVQPLLSSDIDPVARDTLYICWHFASVSMAIMSALFVAAAFSATPIYALAAVGLAAGFCVIGVALVIVRKGRHSALPQGWLFLPVAGLGLAGFLA